MSKTGDTLLDAAGWPGAATPVLVIGHQPTFGLVVARLLGDPSLEWAVGRGSAWWLRGDERGVVLHASQSP